MQSSILSENGTIRCKCRREPGHTQADESGHGDPPSSSEEADGDAGDRTQHDTEDINLSKVPVEVDPVLPDAAAELRPPRQQRDTAEDDVRVEAEVPQPVRQ